MSVKQLIVLALIACLLTAQEKPDSKATCWDLLRDRDYPNALESFRKQRILWPKSPELADGYAWCEWFLGHYDKAEEAFKDALALNSTYSWSLMGMEAIASVRKAPLDEAKAAYDARSYSTARALYERVLDGKTAVTKVGYPLARCGLGKTLLALGRTDDAMKAFRDALKDRSGMPEALRGIAACESARGRLIEALVAYEMSFAGEPDNYEGRIGAGYCHFRKQAWKESLAQYQRAANLAPGTAHAAWTGVAWCHERLASEAAALDAFTKAVEISSVALTVDLRLLIEQRPSWRPLVSKAAWTAIRERLDTAAAAEFGSILAASPGDVSARAGLGLAQFQLGSYADALVNLDTAIAAPTGIPSVTMPVTLTSGKVAEVKINIPTIRAWTLLRLARTDEALAGFQAVFQQSRDLPDAASGIGWSLLTKGDFAAAEGSFAEASRLLPGYPDADSGLDRCRIWRWAEFQAAFNMLRAGKAKEARAEFVRIAADTSGRFPPDRPDIPVAAVGWCDLAAGDGPAAESSFAKALGVNAGCGLAFKGRAMASVNSNDFAGAAGAFTAALADPLYSRDAEAYGGLIRALGEVGKYEQAKRTLDEAKALLPAAAEISVGEGWYLLAQRKQVEARLAFERAIATDPFTCDTPELRARIQKEPEFAKLLGAFGWAWLVRGDLEKAESTFAQAVLRDRNDREAWRGRGLGFLRAGKFKEATEWLEKYLRTAPQKESPWGTVSSIYSEWGWKLYGAGRFGEALDVFNKLSMVHLNERVVYADPYDGIGWCNLKLGRRDPAKAAFLKAISITPRYESSLKGLESLPEN